MSASSSANSAGFTTCASNPAARVAVQARRPRRDLQSPVGYGEGGIGRNHIKMVSLDLQPFLGRHDRQRCPLGEDFRQQARVKGAAPWDHIPL